MECEETENALVPQVNYDWIPKMGQEFESHEEAYKFYNYYARKIGFSVRINNNKNSKRTKEVYWKEFCCSKEGETDNSWQQKYKNLEPRYCTRKRGETRVGCKALLQVQQTGYRWVVTGFNENHNHVLTTPSRVHLLRSHRKVSKAKKVLIQQFTEANIPTCQQLRLMEIDSGGPEAIGCIERDIRNYEKDLRKALAGHDAVTLIDQFLAEKEIDPDFYFDYETDDDGKLVRCIWVDSQCRRSYASFGEVVVFDTTYNTNKYSMIFAPFVGVNNHGQTTIFACGLLSDETTDSFVWLFSKFLEAMTNEVAPPGVIITDQDAAMSKAISVMFPCAMHRYCMWHILNKFSERINVIKFNEEYHKLVNIIKYSETVEQFEKSWTEVMESSDLDCNDWLSSLYEIRDRWVPTFVNSFFSAGMSSSQRSESGHSFVKKYVNKKHTLIQFVAAFKRALRHQRHEELKANHADLNEHPRIATMHSMEEQAMKEYTKYAFLNFQEEFVAGEVYSETMDQKGHVSKASMLIDDAILTDERSIYLDQEIDRLLRIINELNISPSEEINNIRGKSTRSTPIVREPKLVKAKGSGKGLKRPKEMAISKQRRQCKVCGGVGHNRRTCPELKNSQSQVTETDTDTYDEVDEVELDNDTSIRG